MKIVCSFCNPPKVFSEEEPLTDETEMDGICPECYQKLVEQDSISYAPIPESLGKCNILKIHDDGDLTVRCAGKRYVVTTEGEVFAELRDLPLTSEITEQ